MKVFNLPDLGEGLPDAEIVEWLVAEGDAIKTDDPLVSMETAKAVVEVPSPYTGRVAKLFGQAGDVIETGKPLAGFDVEGEEQAGPVEAAPAPGEPEAPATPKSPDRQDSGTVVGAMESSDRLVEETVSNVGGVKVTPAVRALARKLQVARATVRPSGRDGVVTRADVEEAARNPQPPPAPPPEPAAPPAAERVPQPRATPARHQPAPSGEWEPIRGTRRTMARVMSESHAQVVATSIMDDADIHAWTHGQDITVRLLRSLWAGARAEPGLNAWYDGEQNLRMLHKGMHVGMAVDTEDGLFVAALRDIHRSGASEVRAAIDRLRDHVVNRSIPPEDLKGYTIMLSNFGVFAGRYATPIIAPPCVAIVAAGKLRNEVVPVLGGFEVHRTIPLSLTFDHRAVTGGEAARFLKAMLKDLALPE
jgi:pyruvate dehydrogenase E2 component (dihydrolipoamide acetyltransferase)